MCCIPLVAGRVDGHATSVRGEGATAIGAGVRSFTSMDRMYRMGVGDVAVRSTVSCSVDGVRHAYGIRIVVKMSWV